MTWQGVSEAECYDNRSVIAQIVRIKDRLTAVEQNVDPALRTDLEAAIAELTALENTVGNVETQVEANTGNITTLQTDVGEIDTELAGKADSATVDAALALKANAAEVDADLELKADKTQLTDGSVTKVGTAKIGSDGTPIYLNNGVPTVCGLMMPRKTGITGYDTPKNPVYITEELQCHAEIRGGYGIGKVSSTGSDSNATHVWLTKEYLLPTDADTDFAFGWQSLALVIGEFAAPRTIRIAIVDVIIDAKSVTVTAKLKHSTGFDKIMMAIKGKYFHLCVKVTRTSASLVGRHFAGPMIGNHCNTLDSKTSSTGLTWYENATYQGEDIPNFTNYSEWTWTEVQ